MRMNGQVGVLRGYSRIFSIIILHHIYRTGQTTISGECWFRYMVATFTTNRFVYKDAKITSHNK